MVVTINKIIFHKRKRLTNKKGIENASMPTIQHNSPQSTNSSEVGKRAHEEFKLWQEKGTVNYNRRYAPKLQTKQLRFKNTSKFKDSTMNSAKSMRKLKTSLEFKKSQNLSSLQNKKLKPKTGKRSPMI